MDDVEKDNFEIPLKESEINSVLLQALLNTHASVTALASTLIIAIARDEKHALEKQQSLKQSAKNYSRNMFLIFIYNDLG